MKDDQFKLMKAVRQHEPGGKLVIESVPVPRPEKGEVLIRMQAAPVNPSDLTLLKGGYLEREYPFTPGLEGSGLVVESGGGMMGNIRTGKLVACTPGAGGDGTWAEYIKTSAMHTVPLPPGITPEQGSMMLVNPMTAIALMEIAKKGHHQAVVNNAAASALGKMLIRLFGESDLPLINIVRREEQAEELRSLGARYVLNSSDPSFKETLKSRAAGLQATLFLDAIGGEQTSVLMKAAPRGATLLVYARLSWEPMTVDPGWMIVEGKIIEGFQLGRWLQAKSPVSRLRYVSQVKKKISGALGSTVRRIMPMEQVNEAISLYKKEMSSGKVILKL